MAPIRATPTPTRCRCNPRHRCRWRPRTRPRRRRCATSWRTTPAACWSPPIRPAGARPCWKCCRRRDCSPRCSRTGRRSPEASPRGAGGCPSRSPILAWSVCPLRPAARPASSPSRWPRSTTASRSMIPPCACSPNASCSPNAPRNRAAASAPAANPRRSSATSASSRWAHRSCTKTTASAATAGCCRWTSAACPASSSTSNTPRATACTCRSRNWTGSAAIPAPTRTPRRCTTSVASSGRRRRRRQPRRSATSPPNCWRSRPGARRARAWRSMSTG